MHKFGRYLTMGVAAMLILAAAAGCGLFGGDDPVPEEPTPDLAATIAAAVAAAIPTETPTPEPTDTPMPTVPPTPNIAQTLAAMMAAATPPTAVPPTAAPTNTPAPTVPPTAAPTAPAVTSPVSGPPTIITGKVTINGALAPEGTVVYGRAQDGSGNIQAQTDDKGIYRLTSTSIGTVYDLLVKGKDSGIYSAAVTRGGTQAINLSVTE